MARQHDPEGETLYTIREAAKLCGVSRATLLRMEEAGFIVPRVVRPESGFRFYDAANILKIEHCLTLKQMGLSQKDIKAYYSGTMDKRAFLSEAHARLDIAQRCVDEFEAYFSERESVSFGYYRLPEMTCYCFRCPIRDIQAQVEYNYREIARMFDSGFRPCPGTPMLCAVPDLEGVYDGTGAGNPTICVSIDPETAPETAQVAHLEARPSYSLLYHGDDGEIMRTGGQRLLAEMERLGLEPAGPLFGINVVGVFFGSEIDPADYVFRFAIPIKPSDAARQGVDLGR